MKDRQAYVVYLLLEGMFALFFYTVITVNLVYQVEVAKLNALQLVLIGTMLEATAFVCQVPTGILADVFSRRLSIILGVFLTGGTFILEGSIPRFGTILLSQIFFGIGSTFISGAEEAWIAEEVGEEHVGRVFLRGSQVGNLGALCGIVMSVALASIQLNLPIVLGGVMYIFLGLFLVFSMPEHSFAPATREVRNTWRSIRQSMKQTMQQGWLEVRSKPLLVPILGVALFYGLHSEGFDRLWTAHLLADITLPAFGPFKPVVWFGVIRGGVMVLSMLLAEILRRRFDTSKNATVARLLLVMSACQVTTVVIFGLTGSFGLALAMYWGYAVLRSIANPIYNTWLTRNTDGKTRATIISLSGQVDAIGQIAGGPVVGAIGTLVSIRVAIITTGALLSPVMVLLVKAVGLSET